MSDDILSTLEDGILTLSFNRPDSLNAMTTALGNRMAEQIELARRDPDVRVVIVTGAGRAFCAGGDIKNLGAIDERDPISARMAGDPRWNDVEMRVQRLVDGVNAYYKLHTMPKPTIAMVNGPAIGAGMAPALACDFRIVSDQAYFNCAYVNMALSGDIGTSYFLTQVVGPAKARELIMIPQKIDAAEAQRIGLATKVVPHEELLAQTMAFARQFAAGPTLTYGHIKENLQAAIEQDPSVAFDIEARNFMRCFQTVDHKEAVMAFKEKRKPTFVGR